MKITNKNSLSHLEDEEDKDDDGHINSGENENGLCQEGKQDDEVNGINFDVGDI